MSDIIGKSLDDLIGSGRSSGPTTGGRGGRSSGGRGRFGSGRNQAHVRPHPNPQPQAPRLSSTISIRGDLDVEMHEITSFLSNFGAIVREPTVRTQGDQAWLEVTFGTPAEASSAAQGLDGIAPQCWAHGLRGTLKVDIVPASEVPDLKPGSFYTPRGLSAVDAALVQHRVGPAQPSGYNPSGPARGYDARGQGRGDHARPHGGDHHQQRRQHDGRQTQGQQGRGRGGRGGRGDRPPRQEGAERREAASQPQRSATAAPAAVSTAAPADNILSYFDA